MRISVCSRGRRKEPCRFCLGEARHRVVAILGERNEGDAHRFEVRIPDGRRFVLCHHVQADRWELAAAYPRAPRPLRRARAPQPVRMRRAALLLRKGWAALRHLSHHRTNELPLPGAPA
jgi:hypothetical protein